MRRTLRLLFVAVALTLAVSVSGADAQEGQPRERVILWSPQGPVAVERAAGLSASQAGTQKAERLMQALLEGPTSQEAAQGLQTAIPSGTTLAAVLQPSGNAVVVRLRVPGSALSNLSHERFEVIARQIGKTLTPLEWRDLRIQVRDPATGEFVALASFLPEIEVPAKPSGGEELLLSSAASAEEQPAESDHGDLSVSEGMDASAAALAGGEPPVPGQGQPEGALTGKTVYVSAGHGWQWHSYLREWKTQRPPYPSSGYDGVPIIEDHHNGEAVNQYFLNYLWNAGAQVWPMRERDMNTDEAIVDDGSAGYSGSGWTTAPGGHDGDYRWAETTTGGASASATWTASLPSDGRYAVYAWYRSGTNRTEDARYTVHHAGGETTVSVNQQHHGSTWHYIGTYGFLASEPARVTLTNHSKDGGQAVIADAVRFGGGTFDTLDGIETVAGGSPNKPWWEIASYYFTQKMGMPASYGDVPARPAYARWEHAGTGDDAVYVSWHSNGLTGYAQSAASGTETYVHNGEGLPRTDGSLNLAHAIHAEVVNDIRAGWDASWDDRTVKQANLGELRLLYDEEDPSANMPGTLVEVGFHDNPEDADALREPTFNRLVARAMYQGIAKYFNSDATLLPEPPTRLQLLNSGPGQVHVSWKAPPIDTQGLGGDRAQGYRVYTSSNGIGWSNGAEVLGATETTLTDVAEGELLFVRVTAFNEGGESFPTETLAVRGGETAEVLLVNGFDRLNRTMEIQETDPVEGLNARMIQDRMNSYDYAIQHGQAITYPFDSATNGGVRTGSVDLGDYTIVDWILGEESGADETLDALERAMIEGFLESGGALFISGTEIGWHLDGQGADPEFFEQVLRADYRSDDAATYYVGVPSSSIFWGLSPFHFHADGLYDADSADVLATANGSERALTYQGGTRGTAAVQYENEQNECERLVYFAFPFETIAAEARAPVMARVMNFLGACLGSDVDTAIDSPIYESVHETRPPFSGTVQVETGGIDRVEVQVESLSDGKFWSGSQWLSPSDDWLEATGLEAWTYDLPTLPQDGDYHLRARACDADGRCDESPAETIFTYDTLSPTGASLITPTGGVTITALPQLNLAWQAVEPDGGSDLSYEVALDGQIYTSSQSSLLVATVPDGPHTWSVRVVDEAGHHSDWAMEETFAVSREHAWLPLISRGGPAAAPAPACSDAIENGGFEWDGAWLVNPEGYSISSETEVHSGSKSGIVGYDDRTFSSLRQRVTLPAGATATLRLWMYPISDPSSDEIDPGDYHYISIWDERGDRYNLELTTSDAREWRQGEYDLTAFEDQRITVFVGVINDGDGKLTRAYIDDVEVEVCR